MITNAVLFPHPPVIIPEVGGERTKECEETIRTMKEISREIMKGSPETLIFLTPHGNVFSDCISYLSAAELQGNLSRFGHPDIATVRKNDLELLQEITGECKEKGISFIGIDDELANDYQLDASIDHGIMVPLYYLEEAGLKGQAIIAISTGFLDKLELYNFGKILNESAHKIEKRVAVIASGDMSHRLKDEGPYNYHPDGQLFDITIKELIKKGDAKGLLSIPENLRQNAGECGYNSIIIMLGSLDGREFTSNTLSYEGPFGVGYLVAGLQAGKDRISLIPELEGQLKQDIAEKRANESLPVKWARLNLERYIKKGERPGLPTKMNFLQDSKAGAFVSIKKSGQLRGCIGTFLPVHENLAQEIAASALSAGLKDPRFVPVSAGELESLVYSVDILSEPEPCQKEELNPKTYGVIVSLGSRRGLLLPDLEGIDTVEEQLSIALQKGGISPHENYAIERFEVKRFT